MNTERMRPRQGTGGGPRAGAGADPHAACDTPAVPTDRQDLEARLAAATPGDTVRGLIFNALFDAIEQHLGHAAAVAADPARKAIRVEFFSYPVSDFLLIAFEGADRLEEKLGSTDAAFQSFGYRAATNVFSSVLGRTLVALAGNRGVRSLLGQAPNGYKATVSYGARRVEWVDDRRARLVFERDFLVPAFHCGVLRAAIDAMGARPERVEGRQTGPLRSEYEVAWSEG